MTKTQPLSDEQVTQALHALIGWERDGDALVRKVTAPSFMQAIAWVVEIGELAEAAQHHPDIDIRWRTLTLRLSTHELGAITAKDTELAAQIDAVVD